MTQENQSAKTETIEHDHVVPKKGGIFALFGTDQNLEKTGVNIDYSIDANGDPIRFVIARAGGANMRFASVLEAKTKPYKRQIQNGMIDPEIAEKIMREVYAETVVLGWENVSDSDGVVIPFSKENCIKLFEMLPDLYRDIKDLSGQIATFRTEEREADLKN
jgi:hypothetical protein